METSLIVALIGFGRNVFGLVTRPYETCRGIAEKPNPRELLYVGAVLALYFILASLVKIAGFRPFLLTRQFMVLAGAAGVTYCLVVALFWGAGRWVAAEGKLKSLAVLWGYSLLPTVMWFFVTSLLYVLLPPPRTASIRGVLFSVFFLVFSVTLFLWKATMTYLSLRFGLRLDLGKILVVLAICLPVLGFYSYGMYRLGIFKIPFI
jgi:hypothetical protein